MVKAKKEVQNLEDSRGWFSNWYIELGEQDIDGSDCEFQASAKADKMENSDLGAR